MGETQVPIVKTDSGFGDDYYWHAPCFESMEADDTLLALPVPADELSQERTDETVCHLCHYALSDEPHPDEPKEIE